MDTVSVERMAVVGSGESSAMRLVYYEAALQLWMERPLFGAGVGVYAWEWGRYIFHSSTVAIGRVHSDLLEILCEMGTLGVLFLYGAVFIVMIQARQRVVRNDADSDGVLSFAVPLVAVVGFFVHGLVDFHLQIPILLIFVAIYISLIVRGIGVSRLTAQRWGGARVLVPCVAVVSLGMLLTCGLRSAKMVKILGDAESFDVNSGKLSLEKKVPLLENIEKQESQLKRGLELYSADTYAWGLMGRIHGLRLKHKEQNYEVVLAYSQFCFNNAIVSSSRGFGGEYDGFWMWWENLGMLHLNAQPAGSLGMVDMAFQEAVHRAPGRMWLRVRYADFLFRVGELDRAKSHLLVAERGGSEEVIQECVKLRSAYLN